jgi:hypothetical protein
MSRPFTPYLLIILLFWVTGGQWLMLQSVAWINMVRDYSQSSTLSRALIKTFDGNHPCPLCRFIQKEKSAQNSAKTIPTPPKNLFLLIPFAILMNLFLSQPRFKFTRMFLLEPLSPLLSPPPESISQS